MTKGPTVPELPPMNPEDLYKCRTTDCPNRDQVYEVIQPFNGSPDVVLPVYPVCGRCRIALARVHVLRVSFDPVYATETPRTTPPPAMTYRPEESPTTWHHPEPEHNPHGDIPPHDALWSMARPRQP
jgi:hypothetical protein